MNPILFNHHLKRAIETLPDYEIHRRIFKDWRNAPLFDYATSWDHEREVFPEGMTIIQLLQCKWPFNTLRLSMTESDVPAAADVPGSPRANYQTNFVAAKKDEGFVLMIEPKTMGHEHDLLKGVWPFYLFVTTHKDMRGMRLSFEPDELDAGWGFTYAMNGKWSRNTLGDRKGILYDDTGRKTLLGLRPLVQSMLAAFSTFIADAMMPTNFLAEVRPVSDDRRSVEWVKARTHFTLITHGHPANRRELATPGKNVLPIVATDKAGELTRMAHSRRAHPRTYRHSRFTYARGKTIMVKEAWIGPKEWRDEGGKQIYKILEPVDEQIAQLAV